MLYADGVIDVHIDRIYRRKNSLEIFIEMNFSRNEPKFQFYGFDSHRVALRLFETTYI